MYLSFIGLIVLIREIIKDILSEKGDLIFGYETLPIKVGAKGAKRTIFLLMFLTILPFGVLYYLHGTTLVMGYFFVGELLVLISAFLLQKAKTDKDFERLNSIYKFLLLAGVLSIPLV